MVETSLKYMPLYTEALIETLAKTDDLDEGYRMASRLQSINSHIPIVYDVLAVYEYQQQHYDTMVKYKEKSIELKRKINIISTLLH